MVAEPEDIDRARAELNQRLRRQRTEQQIFVICARHRRRVTLKRYLLNSVSHRAVAAGAPA